VKRSEIDAAVRRLRDVAAAKGFHLPPWAHWSPSQWAAAGHEADEVRRYGLGWDVTDFGRGEFARLGLTLLTLRNGPVGAPGRGEKDYCEKVMLVGPGQVTPCHFHVAKMEDIINRAGGRLVIRLHHATADGGLDESASVSVQVDGLTREFPPGGELVLTPGESVTLPPRLYHAFWGAAGDEPVLVGEVSRVNDDANDNRFLEPLGRFPEIAEDQPAEFVLCTEYPDAR